MGARRIICHVEYSETSQPLNEAETLRQAQGDNKDV